MSTYYRKFKISLCGIEWGQSDVTLNSDLYFYYFYWWNWLPKISRYWGYEQIEYDGYHNTFGLWYTNISWSTYWSRKAKS